MNYYTFRKSDNTHLYTAHNEKSQEGQWAACLANEGGVAEDFIVITSTRQLPERMEATLVGNKLTFVEAAEVIVQRLLSDQIATRLKGLGFTEEESRRLL